jgi:hypothetical protein
MRRYPHLPALTGNFPHLSASIRGYAGRSVVQYADTLAPQSLPRPIRTMYRCGILSDFRISP